MKSTSVRMWAVAVVAAAGIAGASAWGVASAESGRRFQGSGEGVVVEVVSATELVIDYAGTATHLGSYTRRERVTFGAGGSISGTIVFVAANGDELDASFAGQFVSQNDAVGTYTFTGGTGRFSDATGTADFTASTPDFVNVSIEFEGTIDY